uniref:U2266g n=1 Tax=Mycobacterium leprae TaxID=1769 RepID=Q50032_MYCLR|nr:u2266g [Mycobacterium leprae]
MDLSNCEGRL